MSTLCWSLTSPSAAEQHIFDTNTNTWARGANGGRVVPTTLSLVTGISITLQSVGAGYSAEVKSKSPPEIAVYNATGALTDAVVDLTLHGIRS